VDHLLLITGSMGTGKTTILGEASDLLVARDIVHAAIDLDALGLAHIPQPSTHDLVSANLAAMCSNYAAAGVGRLMVAGAIESRAELEGIRQSTLARRMVVCRLRARLPVMEARVAGRERGINAHRYLARVRELEAILDGASLEDVSVETGEVPITQVAEKVLRLAGWL
jgi:adenylylsulfate kinase